MDEVTKDHVDVRMYATPGYGDRQLGGMHYHQALRIGDRVEISGQGGWDDDFTFPEALADEIVAAFDNVGRTLATAGATWADVVAIESFHVPTSPDSIGDAHNDVMVAELKRRTAGRAPIWTQLGVTALGAAGMRIEIRVTAVVGSAPRPQGS